MTSSEQEIRRHANGSIDTAYYVAHCHRQRSLAAHRAIARLAQGARAFVARIVVRGRDAGAKAIEVKDDHAPAPATRKSLRKAA